jgi:hypothetical protein
MPSTRRYAWSAPDILKALQRWTRRHGRPPRSMEWAHAPPGYPSAGTVRAHFGHFADALHTAGIEPGARQPYQLKYWRRDEIVASLRDWSQQQGRSPLAFDWIRAAPGHPCSSTVRNHFRGWDDAVRSAGLAPRTA